MKCSVCAEGGVEDGQALIGDPQALGGEKGLELVAGRFGAHGRKCPVGGRGCQLKGRPATATRCVARLYLNDIILVIVVISSMAVAVVSPDFSARFQAFPFIA